jgi:hypothetical protein
VTESCEEVFSGGHDGYIAMATHYYISSVSFPDRKHLRARHDASYGMYACMPTQTSGKLPSLCQSSTSRVYT